jgi:hypothetical protein
MQTRRDPGQLPVGHPPTVTMRSVGRAAARVLGREVGPTVVAARNAAGTIDAALRTLASERTPGSAARDRGRTTPRCDTVDARDRAALAPVWERTAFKRWRGWGEWRIHPVRFLFR